MTSDEAIIEEVYQWCEDALLDLSTTADSRRALLQAIQKARAHEQVKHIKIERDYEKQLEENDKSEAEIRASERAKIKEKLILLAENISNRKLISKTAAHVACLEIDKIFAEELGGAS